MAAMASKKSSASAVRMLVSQCQALRIYLTKNLL